MSDDVPVNNGDEDWRNQLTAPNVLAALVEGWKLLLGGIVIACLVAFLMLQFGRNASVWEVVAVFNLPETQAKQLTTPQVLEQVVQALAIQVSENGASAHEVLRDRISVSPVSATRQMAVFRGDTAEAASELAAAVVAAAPAAIALPPAQQRFLHIELERIEASLPDYELAIRREGMLIRCVLGEEVEALPGDETPCGDGVPLVKDGASFEQVRYYVSLLDNYRHLNIRLAEIRQALRDPAEDLLQVAPGLARQVIEGRRMVNWALAALIGLGFGALAVWLREVFRAMRRTNSAGRYDRLLAVLPPWTLS